MLRMVLVKIGATYGLCANWFITQLTTLLDSRKQRMTGISVAGSKRMQEEMGFGRRRSKVKQEPTHPIEAESKDTQELSERLSERLDNLESQGQQTASKVDSIQSTVQSLRAQVLQMQSKAEQPSSEPGNGRTLKSAEYLELVTQIAQVKKDVQGLITEQVVPNGLAMSKSLQDGLGKRRESSVFSVDFADLPVWQQPSH